MEEVTTEIKVIKAILASFTEFPDKPREERLNELKTAFPNNKYVFTYFDYERQDLREILKEQTKKENLILAQGKGGGKI